MRFCPNCGQSVEEGFNFCRNCGHNLGTNPNPVPINQPNYVRQPIQPAYSMSSQKKVGTGLAIASLVLGIIATYFSFVLLITLSNGELEKALIQEYSKGMLSEMEAKVSFGIGYVLIPVVTGVLALIFGIKRKSFARGKAGIILGSIALLFSIICFIYTLSISL